MHRVGKRIRNLNQRRLHFYLRVIMHLQCLYSREVHILSLFRIEESVEHEMKYYRGCTGERELNCGLVQVYI